MSYETKQQGIDRIFENQIRVLKAREESFEKGYQLGLEAGRNGAFMDAEEMFNSGEEFNKINSMVYKEWKLNQKLMENLLIKIEKARVEVL